MITQYGHDSWISQNGLPGEAVYQIVQTSDGYLWLRSSSGLVRFDGNRFSFVSTKQPGDSGTDAVRAICLSRDGGLIVRGVEKTLQLRNGKYSALLAPAALPHRVVRQVIEMRSGQLWVGADDSLYAAQNGQLKMVQDETQWITAFLEDRVGHLWIGSSFALSQYDGRKLTTYAYGHKEEGVEALAQDPTGTLWVGTRHGLHRLEGSRLTEVTLMNPLAGKRVTAILWDRTGGLWVGTDGFGVFRLSEGRWSQFSRSDGLTDDAVLSLQEDREGSIWAGTKSGLDRFRETKILPYTKREGLINDDTSTVAQRSDGSVYIFSEGGGLTELKGDEVKHYTAEDGLGSNYGGSMFEDSQGSLWIGTDMGLSRLKDGKIRNYTANGQFLTQFVSAIGEDEEGLIVTAANRHLYHMTQGRFTPFTLNGLPSPLTAGQYVHCISRDADGTLWAATDGVFYKFPKQSAEQAKREGIRYESFPFPDVEQIYDDGRGSLWLVQGQAGLLRYRTRDSRVTRYTTRCGLLDNDLSRVLADQYGQLWMSSARGIFSVARQDLDDYAEGKLQRVRCAVYGTTDGMRTAEASLAKHQPAGWTTQDGRLWFTTRKGVAVIDPAHIPLNTLAPPVEIEEARVNQDLYRPEPDMKIPSGEKNIELHYTALSFLIPERMRFRYRLETYDRDWVDAGNRREAYYTHLAPGRYRFQVIGSNSDGVWNRTGATWDFSITPAYYQTIWFRSVCLLAALAALSLLYMFRLRRLSTQMQGRFDERLAERMRIARELHDTLLQNMTGLSLQIAGLSKVVATPEVARERLQGLRQQAEDCLREARQSVWDIREAEIIDVGAALRESGERFTAGKSTKFSFLVEGASVPIEATARQQLLRIGREAIGNAVHHAQATRIDALLSFQPGLIMLRISDDGCGFDPDRAGSLPGHFGMVTMRERAEQLHGSITISSKVGQGTCIQVSVPSSRDLG